MGNTAYGSMTSGAYALNGTIMVLRTLKLLTIIKGNIKMPRTPIHPGEILADELQELNMSASELALEIMVPANRLTQIVAGKRSITAETALRLGKWFGTGPNIWLNLQQAYDLDLISKKMAPAIKEIRTRGTLGPFINL